MKSIRALFVFVVAAVLPLAASAFEQPRLDAAADAYLGGLRARFAGEPIVAADSATEARVLAAQKKWQDAVGEYERAVAADTTDARVWLSLAVAWLNLDAQNPHGAEAAYRAFTESATDGERAQSLNVLGAALERRSRYDEAIQAFRASLALVPEPKIETHLAGLVEAHGFRATGVEVNAESDPPEFCVVFRGALDAGRRVRYDDYVRTQPPVPGGFAVRKDRLCAGGLDHGDQYSVTVLAGLPSASGEKTPEAETYAVEIGDRAPSVGFRGSTYILPRIGSTGVPVITVNVSKVRLKILRIDERALITQMQQGRILQLLGTWDIDQLANDEGELVWQGEMDVANEKNARVTTAFDVGPVLGKTRPGIYAVVAEPIDVETNRWSPRATQWLVVSDLGLTTFSGADGMRVFARSLASARPQAGVAVRLYARNNALLAEATTDAHGAARFDAGLLAGDGGRAPKALFAQTAAGDFNFLDVSAPAFDLSDRGVGGRVPPGPLDAYLYSERGVYRPGETAHVVALLRDDAARAAEDLPLELKLLRPDGAEARRETIPAGTLGAYALDLPFSTGALTGRWTVEARVDPKAAPIGTLSFLVEDVVPPRIEVKLSTDAESLTPGSAAPITVKADYLYGAPAGNLAAEGEVTVLADDAAHPDWPGYRFGLADETVKPQRARLPIEATDASGEIAVKVALDKVPDTTLPLKAVIRAGVFELGGRPATASLTLPVHVRGAVGVRPKFDKGAVAEGTEAGFDVIALDVAGKRAAATLEYAFYKEDWIYQWFRRGGAWDYEVHVADSPLASGKLAVDAGTPAQLTQRVDWGRYRLEVYDPQTGAASSVRFRAGWFVAPSAGDTPDTLEVTADKSGYAPGETARLFIKPPFGAEVLLAIANDRVITTRSVAIPADGATVEIPVTPDWGVGAYALATAFRPDAPARGPGRAIGLAWLPLDAAPRTLSIAIDAPKATRPRGTTEVALKVSGLDAGKPAYVTLAAVDEGVLGLTGFKTPDPAGHFYGKRRLGVALRDLYGRLIDGKTQRRGNVRSGGGDARLANRGAPPVDVHIAALFSGLVTLDAEGRATVPLSLPDFNGRLRLMAVAFDESRVGSAEAAMTVRDPLIAQVSLPRFLAPDDASRLTLTLDDLELPAGDVSVTFAADGAVSFAGPATLSRALAPGRSAAATFDVKAGEPGLGKIAMTLDGPGGFHVERDWTLAVRPAQFRVTQRLARRIEPGGTASYSAAVLAPFVAGTGEVLLTFSPRPDLDVPGLLRMLDRYPYGCLEQTVSRALPLLYVADVAEVWGGPGAGPQARARVDSAIRRVFEMQRPDGGFALWAPSGDAETWLSAYALDFLARAKAKGHNVPRHAFAAGLDWLSGRVRAAETAEKADMSAVAYALYVLAEAGVGDAAEARYFADRTVDKLPDPMTAAHLAAALALNGEADRARFTFGKALVRVGKRGDVRDYGSNLRDLAGLVALAAETEPVVPGVERDWSGRTLGDLVADLSARQASAEYLSTQEQAWLLIAAAATARDAGAMKLSVDGKALPERNAPLRVRPGDARLASGLDYANAGTGMIWHTATVSGIPSARLPATSAGFAITRGFYTLDGQPADLAAVRQNDVLVAVIEGEAAGDVDHQALIVDLLPAGFEIENARLDDARTAREIAWLPRLSETLHAEYRDDRFVAALDIKGEKRGFAAAYLVRAVTPGTYALPAAHVEDMYKPQFRGRTSMGTLVIEPRS